MVAYKRLMFAEKDFLLLECTACLADSSAGLLQSQPTTSASCQSWHNAWVLWEGVTATVDLSLLQPSAGLTQPHPNSGCILVNQQGHVIAKAYQHAQVSSISMHAQLLVSLRNASSVFMHMLSP